MDEQPTPSVERTLGGRVTDVVQVGNTVRRATGPWTPAVHALLRYLETVEFPGAPRVLGLDARGREELTFVPGEVPRATSPDVVSDAVLGEVGRLIRRYHDAVAGFVLPSGLSWHWGSKPTSSDARLVICHNDLAPHNTVFRDGRPVAFIDWDFASPGPAVWDVANAAWQFVPLGGDDAGVAESSDRFRRLRILCDAYALPEDERAILAVVVARRMEATAGGIEALAATGEPAFQRLLDDGVPAQIRREREWVRHNASRIREALS